MTAYLAAAAVVAAITLVLVGVAFVILYLATPPKQGGYDD